MNDIERADKIADFHPAQWTSGAFRANARRCRYLDWIAEQPRTEAEPHLASCIPWLGIASLTTEALATVIVAIDDARKPKGDGLPPGPWKVVRGVNDIACVVDAGGGGVCSLFDWSERRRHYAAHIARCGSRPVRDILAACEDEELERLAGILMRFRSDVLYLQAAIVTGIRNGVEMVAPCAAALMMHPR